MCPKHISFFFHLNTHDEVSECHPPLASAGNLTDPGVFGASKNSNSDRNGMNLPRRTDLHVPVLDVFKRPRPPRFLLDDGKVVKTKDMFGPPPKKHPQNGRVYIWMFPKIGVFPPKSSILIRFSMINHPFWGTLIFGNTHIYT